VDKDNEEIHCGSNKMNINCIVTDGCFWIEKLCQESLSAAECEDITVAVLVKKQEENKNL
jgi:hypothetical protein